MVRVSLLTVIICLAGCSSGKKEPSFTKDVAFDKDAYELGNFTARVQSFLKNRKETKGMNAYQAIFVNTKDCSACMRGGLSQMVPFLEQVKVPTYIYANDSSLMNLIPANEKVEFIHLHEEDFRKADVFHSELYLYVVKEDEITTTFLDKRNVDSLNSIKNL